MEQLVEQQDLWKIGATTAPLPPLVKGFPLVGNIFSMSQGITPFLVDAYQEYGPIFRINLLGGYTTVLAGLDANRFLTRHGEEVFSSEITYADMTNSGVGAFFASPPAEHKHLRSLVKDYFSQEVAVNGIADSVQVINQFVDTLKVGDSFKVIPTLRKLVINMLGRLLLDYPPGEYYDDCNTFMRNLMKVHQFKTRPAWVLKLPKHKRAKARVYELAQKAIDHAKQTVPGRDRPENVLDKLMQAEDIDGKPFGESFLQKVAMVPYVSAQDSMTGALSLICCVIHRHEDIRDQITQEVFQGFATGIPTFEELRQFKLLHQAILETLRLYPVAPLLPRYAAQPFEFAGYRVDTGKVFNAISLPHFLPEYHPDPWSFRVDRERAKAETFVPFGVGKHTCVASSIARVLLMVTIATLLRRGKFSLVPNHETTDFRKINLSNIENYPLKLKLLEKYESL